jgi:L-gulonate 3-dehydrogenase
VPIVLQKEIDGFVVNRLQYGLLGEAFRLVQDGVVAVTDYNPKSISFFFFFLYLFPPTLSHTKPTDVDLAISQGLGLRWSFMGYLYHHLYLWYLCLCWYA